VRSRRRRQRAACGRLAALGVAVLALAASPARGGAQAPPRGAPPPPLFRSDSVLTLTIRGDLRHLFRDRDTTGVPWREGTVTIAGEGGAPSVTVPVRMRTRGIYRLAHCDIPPIRLRFREGEVRGTPLDSLGRPKLTSVCQNRDSYEQYLLLEYAIYKIYRLLTPISPSARLLRVTYEDSAGAMRPFTHYAFLTEDPERFAERMGGTLVDSLGIGFRRLQRDNIMLLSVFQYLIGNTDWAVPYLHNIELLRTDSLYAFTYDFDWSGAVDAPYAEPNRRILHIQTVRDRQYRGICATSDAVFDHFVALRDSIAAVYRAVPGLSPRNVDRAISYVDSFYQELADRPRFLSRRIGPDCGW
jgi:hypothetical protein